jgi:uncharacterized cupin superfamily protein
MAPPLAQRETKMPKLELEAIEQINRTTYPEPFAAEMTGRFHRRLAPAAGLTDFGVSHVVLKPGGISSQRHWHEEEDDFVVLLSGEAVLIEEEGETVMRPGDCAAFPKGVPNGHHFVNRSGEDCVFIAVGRVPAADCHYPDIDLHLDGASGRFTRKDGTPY